MSDRPRVFLVEDHEITRAGARHYLGDEYEVVGEASSVSGAVTAIQTTRPDIVLLDIRIIEGSGAEVVAQIRETHPEIKFLAVTVSTSREDVVRMFDLGIDGYLTKTAVGAELPELVAQTLRGAKPISRQVAAYLLDIDEDVTDESGVTRLTRRERDVVGRIARGFTYKEAAAELDMSVKTLENHMASIFSKLGIASRYELAELARQTGLVESAE